VARVRHSAELRPSMSWPAELSTGSDPARPRRGPIWPAGVLGSMTHCTGYAAAAVAPLPRISAVGIDAEPDAPLPDGVLELVATPAERDRLTAARPESDGPNWDRLLFSAKEAVYKAWFLLVGEWLDHQEAEIRFHPQELTFTAQLSRDGLVIDRRQIHRLHGRWIRMRGILVTAVVLGSSVTRPRRTTLTLWRCSC
jgi:4'-phosphopantetheinyl transferase EntD